MDAKLKQLFKIFTLSLLLNKSSMLYDLTTLQGLNYPSRQYESSSQWKNFLNSMNYMTKYVIKVAIKVSVREKDSW